MKQQLVYSFLKRHWHTALTAVLPLLVLAVLTGCNAHIADSFTLNQQVVTLYIDSTYTLLPQGEEPENITWLSEHPHIASVDANGVVTAHATGQVTLEASNPKGAKAIAVVVVTGINTQALPKMVRSQKRGVSVKFTILEDVAALAPAVSWSYNWGYDPSTELQTLFSTHKMDYFPMAWGRNYNPDGIRAYKQANPECEYLLAFNEPNLTDQARMTPQEAAALWPPLKALADELGMKLVSPAMNYGTLEGYHDPILWLDEFFQLVPLSDIAAISIHSYMSSPNGVKEYIELFEKYQKPIWMTEFCAWDQNITNVTKQMNYMSQVVQMMEIHPLVERYAWFIPRASGALDSYPYMQLFTKEYPSELAPLGHVYSAITTFDKNLWHRTPQHIHATAYAGVCMQEYTADYLPPAPNLRASTDGSGLVELTDFFNNQWVEYQVTVTQPTSTIALHYATYTDSEIAVQVQNQTLATVPLPSTGSTTTWSTATAAIQLPQGNHTVRLLVTKGAVTTNWLKLY